MTAYRLEPARVADAALLAAMSRQFVEAGLRPAWDAARIAWHIRHPDSVVLAARSSSAMVKVPAVSAVSSSHATRRRATPRRRCAGTTASRLR